MNLNVLLVQACTFLAVSGVMYLAFRGIWSLDKRVRGRIEGLRHSRTISLPNAASRKSAALGSKTGTKILGLAARLVPNDHRERTQLEARLMHAGIYAPWAPSVFMSVKMCLIIAPPVLGFLLGEAGVFEPHKSLFYGAIAGGFGILLPRLWLDRRKARRQAILSRSLPDLLDLMVTCVQSGMSMEAALQRVTNEIEVAHPVLADEMAVVQRQIELGAPPDVAIRNFAERSDLASLFSLSSLLEQARRFGTSLTEALRTQAEMMRYNREQRAEELAQKAAVKILFPTLLFIFPAIFVVLVGPAAVQLSEIFSPNSNRAVQEK
jgi:tight adherence protein C